MIVESFEMFHSDYLVIRRCIEDGVAPFKTGDIVVTITNAMFEVPKLRVDVSAFPNNPCFIQDRNLWDVAPYGDSRDYIRLLNEVGFRAAQHYRSIPALPVDDNVVLGYN